MSATGVFSVQCSARPLITYPISQPKGNSIPIFTTDYRGVSRKGLRFRCLRELFRGASVVGGMVSSNEVPALKHRTPDTRNLTPETSRRSGDGVNALNVELTLMNDR